MTLPDAPKNLTNLPKITSIKKVAFSYLTGFNGGDTQVKFEIWSDLDG